MRIHATAPGKLVILGEYAVLFGAPALVAAVDRRAVIDVRPSRNGRFVVSAPGVLDQSVELVVQADGNLGWPDDAPGLPLVERILSEYPGLSDMEPMEIRMDTRSFFHPSGSKLGLGSSAALTTALVAAIDLYCGREAPDPARLIGLHRAYQGGAGSGVDVAASFMGGFQEYHIEDNRPHCRVRKLPRRFFPAFVWTGSPAGTAAFLDHLGKSLHRSAVAEALDSMGRLARKGCVALDDPPAFLGILDAYADAMEHLGAAAGMEILSTEHRRLRSAAREAGVAYKPSGAGGGDFGLVASDSREKLENFLQRVEEMGFEIPALHIEPEGLRCTRLEN